MARKKTNRNSKIEWLSLDKFVFTHDFAGRCCGCGVKDMLIVAKRHGKLRCFRCKKVVGQDYLCWFCEHGISLELVGKRRNLDCLMGKGTEDVYFCDDFKPGHAFGEDKKNDLGERRKKAENMFSRFVFESCYDCKHRNRENVIKTQDIGGKTLVFHEPEAAFCEKEKRFHDWRTFARILN